jgi:WhiB family redox-sensing transcriptional regulator
VSRLPTIPIDRILRGVDTTADCWTRPAGTATIRLDGGRWAVHRAAYTYLVGPIPPRHHVRRTCSTAACIRPDHLIVVPAEKPSRPITDVGPVAARRAHADAAGRARASNVPAADWRHRAACRGEDPELFFPVGTGPDAKVQTALAKQVCRACPVAGACGTWAMDHGYDSGVWGGTTEAERVAAKRRAARIRSKGLT